MHVGKKTLKREKSAMTLSLYGSLVFAIVEIGWLFFPVLRQFFWMQFTTASNFL